MFKAFITTAPQTLLGLILDYNLKSLSQRDSQQDLVGLVDLHHRYISGLVDVHHQYTYI